MKEFHNPTDQIKPDNVMVNEVDYQRIPTLLINVKGHNKNHPEKRADHQQNCLEFVLRDH